MCLSGTLYRASRVINVTICKIAKVRKHKDDEFCAASMLIRRVENEARILRNAT